MNTLKTIADVNGKKLKSPQVNLLAKLADTYNVSLPETAQSRTNPYTGATRTLQPLAVALHDFIVDNYRNDNVKGQSLSANMKTTAIPTNVWDAARNFFRTFWPDEYFDLID